MSETDVAFANCALYHWAQWITVF